jgi:cytochrome c biogenesis protein CcdA
VIDTAALGFALGAGLVAALNPCGFAFLPGYLGLVIAGSSQAPSRPAALARAGMATIAMSVGFLTVFGLFGLVVSPLIASVQKYLPFATVVIGVLLVVLAIWLLAGKDIGIMLPKLSSSAPTARLRSMFGYGVAYAVASLPCTVAPFLAVISTTFKQGSILTGILAFIAYAAGMAITVGVAALAVALAGSSAATASRRILPHVGRIAGVIVLLTGLYVTWAPSKRPVSACATSLTSPRASRATEARGTCVSDSTRDATGMPAEIASSSVSPTAATAGLVKVTRGSAE